MMTERPPMSHPVKSPKKLIEVALPLDAINKASAREDQSVRGNPIGSAQMVGAGGLWRRRGP